PIYPVTVARNGRAHLETVAARKRIRGKGLRLLLESPDHIGIQYQVIPISHVPNVERTKSRHIRDMRYRAPPVDTRLLVDISHLPAEIIDFPVDGKRRKNLVVPQDVREHPLYTAGYTRAVTATHGHAHAAIGEVVKLEIGPIGYGGDLLLVYAAKEVEIGQVGIDHIDRPDSRGRQHGRIKVDHVRVDLHGFKFRRVCAVNAVFARAVVGIYDIVGSRQAQRRRVFGNAADTGKILGHALDLAALQRITVHIAESVAVGQEVNLAAIGRKLRIEVVGSLEDINVF